MAPEQVPTMYSNYYWPSPGEAVPNLICTPLDTSIGSLVMSVVAMGRSATLVAYEPIV